ncbi:hypothetical protein [Streptomyces albus]|uniref:hypothetical protein n=1 Tax=Streptomyces albus TaxID=1888 RepID=UPI0033C476BE
MASSLTPAEIQQLALIKFMYGGGVEESRRPHPLSATAVLKFHDAVELFLGLAASHLGAGVNPKIDFLEYWGQIKSQTQVVIPGKTGMDKLNHARVGFKHKGLIPAVQTIERCRDEVLKFFTTATPVVFSLDFDDVDMADLVTQPKVTRLLREAQTHADLGDHAHAMAGLSLAFQQLLDHYSDRSSYGPNGTPFAFGPPLTRRDLRRDPQRRPLSDPELRLDRVTAIAGLTQQAMQVMSLSIDFPGFARFLALVPRVDGYMDGSFRYTVTKTLQSLTTEDYSWARDFVIQSALQASRADDVLALWRDQWTANWNPKAPNQERTWTGPAQTT